MLTVDKSKRAPVGRSLRAGPCRGQLSRAPALGATTSREIAGAAPPGVRVSSSALLHAQAHAPGDQCFEQPFEHLRVLVRHVAEHTADDTPPRAARSNDPPTSLGGEADLDVSAVAAGQTCDEALVLELRDEAHRPRVCDPKHIGDAAQVGTA